MASAASPGPFSFDPLARSFDGRAGLPAEAVDPIAAALVELARPAADELVVEVGAGTGVLGAALARRVPRYLGIDLALAMLAVARPRLRRGADAASAPGKSLIQADANHSWPIAPGTARLVFLSRAAHLLATEHLAAEARRVAQARGAYLVLGRVRRDAGSVRREMRRRMLHLLTGRGVEGRRAERARERLEGLLQRHGARVLPPRTAATWERPERPAGALAAWRAKPGLAGVELPAAVRDAVLADLERWARGRYGDLDVPRPSQERYELRAIALPGV